MHQLPKNYIHEHNFSLFLPGIYCIFSICCINLPSYQTTMISSSTQWILALWGRKLMVELMQIWSNLRLAYAPLWSHLHDTFVHSLVFTSFFFSLTVRAWSKKRNIEGSFPVSPFPFSTDLSDFHMPLAKGAPSPSLSILPCSVAQL